MPYRWRGRELHELGERAGELVPVDRGGDRRVLSLSNPGLGGAPYATATLWGAVQYLGPGERAPAHRHTPAALRFVLDGEGVWTLVNGDPLHMSAGDLILTPSWTWHGHHNPGDTPMTWFDALDLPLVEALDAMFFEPGEGRTASSATAERSTSEVLFGGGPGLLPGGTRAPAPAHSPAAAALPAGPPAVRCRRPRASAASDLRRPRTSSPAAPTTTTPTRTGCTSRPRSDPVRSVRPGKNPGRVGRPRGGPGARVGRMPPGGMRPIAPSYTYGFRTRSCVRPLRHACGWSTVSSVSAVAACFRSVLRPARRSRRVSTIV